MTAPTTSSEPPPSRLSRRGAQERLIAMGRGDAVAAVAGLLVFICSFLPQVSATTGGISYHAHMWHALALVEVFAVPLLALVVVGFTLLPIQQTAYADADVLGVRPAAWRTVLSLVVAVASVFALFFWGHIASDSAGHIGYGAYLVLVFSLACAAGAVLPAYVPELRLPLASARAPKAAAPEDVGSSAAVGWQPPTTPGTTTTGGPVQSDPVPPVEVAAPEQGNRGADATQSFEPLAPEPPADEPLPPEPFADDFPAPQPFTDEAGAAEPFAEEPAAPEPVAPEPVAPPQAAPTPPTPPASFEPFWACFPTIRPLVDRTDTALTIGQVSPEEWYLVTGQDERGASVSTSDGRPGLLLDTSGLIRADQTA